MATEILPGPQLLRRAWTGQLGQAWFKGRPGLGCGNQSALRWRLAELYVWVSSCLTHM